MSMSDENKQKAADRMKKYWNKRKNIVTNDPSDLKTEVISTGTAIVLTETSTNSPNSVTVSPNSFTVEMKQNVDKPNGTMTGDIPGTPNPPKKMRFIPYTGSDNLPPPNEGKTYGEPRYYVSGSELIQVRKKIIYDPKSTASGYVVQKTCFLNIKTKSAKQSGIRHILKQCGIPGAS